MLGLKGSGAGDQGFKRRVHGSPEKTQEAKTPKTPIKPRIVYPCSPGGTEIRPPKGTPPDSPQVPSVENVGISCGDTEDPRRYAPGDKVWWSLPKLQEPGVDAAIKTSDWFVQAEVTMGDLCAGSKEWWSKIMTCAREAYERWRTSSALERLAVQPCVSQELQSDKYSRLESRAFSMLQASLPASVSEELLVCRQLTCVWAVFITLKTYQPGGLAERTRLLDALQTPGAGSSAKDVLDRLRVWSRHLARAISMQISVPDASLLLKGVDSLCSSQLAKHEQVNFRMSVVRTKLSLDHAPSQDSVREYVTALHSEFAMLALADVGEGKGKRERKVAAAKLQDGAAGKGSGKKGEPEKGSGNEAPKKACKGWFTDRGCAYGNRCRFAHVPPVTKGSGRCFLCSGKGHQKPNCPNKEGKGSGAGPGEEGGVEPAAKAGAKAAAKVAAVKAGKAEGSREGSEVASGTEREDRRRPTPMLLTFRLTAPRPDSSERLLKP